MQVELIKIPTGGVRYYVSSNPNPATPRVEAECSKSPGPPLPLLKEPGKSKVQNHKETKR
jgi:hypothetical protein